MANTTKAKFQLKSFTVVNFSIERQPIKQTEGDIDILPSGIVDRKKKTFSLVLNIKLKDKNESFNLSMSCIGLFKFRSETPPSELSNYFLTNAPAIIFPYVRSYISAVTALSGLEAVNLPVMNLTGLKEALAANLSESED